MPIDLEKILGAELPATEASWDEDRVILYHLGIGAGNPPTDENELSYTYEARLKVLPTFATIPPFASLINIAAVDGLDVNFARLLHGEQDLILSGPIPTSARVENTARISAVYDKGKGVLVVVEITTTDSSGKELFTNRSSLFIRGEGGFGGESGPAPGNEPPARRPDEVHQFRTLPQQALLYRLSGDKNPLHVDPAFAAMGGFDRPILHGLCSYGIVCKAVCDRVFDGDVTAIKRYQARFSGVVLPGETIVTNIWDEENRLIISAATKERGTPVITNAAIWR